MSKSVKRVRQALAEAGLADGIKEMSDGTRTAEAAAAALGVEVDQIAKSVIFRGAESGRPVLFVTAGGNRVDAVLAADLAGEALDRADAAFVRARTGFVIGGVAPIGHLEPPKAWFDPHLLTFPVVWAAAGTPNHVFPADPSRLADISGAEIAPFALSGEKM